MAGELRPTVGEVEAAAVEAEIVVATRLETLWPNAPPAKLGSIARVSSKRTAIACPSKLQLAAIIRRADIFGCSSAPSWPLGYKQTIAAPSAAVSATNRPSASWHSVS